MKEAKQTEKNTFHEIHAHTQGSRESVKKGTYEMHWSKSDNITSQI